MDMMNWSLLEVITEQKTRELREAHERLLPLEEAGEPRTGVRPALARTLVRAGLRLDPSAGQRLAGRRLAPVRK